MFKDYEYTENILMKLVYLEAPATGFQYGLRLSMLILGAIGMFSVSGVYAQSLKEGYYVGELEWVKLHAKDWSNAGKRQKNKDGFEETAISNSCGQGEAYYTLSNGQKMTVPFTIGEWCETPFPPKTSRRQLIGIGPKGDLREFYDIVKDSDDREYVQVKGWSNLKPLERDLATPSWLESVKPGAQLQNAREHFQYEIETGYISIQGNDVYVMKGVFLESVFEEKSLREE